MRPAGAAGRRPGPGRPRRSRTARRGRPRGEAAKRPACTVDGSPPLPLGLPQPVTGSSQPGPAEYPVTAVDEMITVLLAVGMSWKAGGEGGGPPAAAGPEGGLDVDVSFPVSETGDLSPFR